MESDRPPQKHTKTGTTRELRERAGGWIRFVGAMGDPDATQQRAIKRHGAFVDTLDSTEMVKSYKMLVLHAMLNATKFPGSIELSDHVAQFGTRTSRAAADIGSALNDRKALIRLLEQNPLAAWAGGQGTAGFWHLSYGQRDLSDNVHRRTGFSSGASGDGPRARRMATHRAPRSRPNTDIRLLNAEGESSE